MTTTYEPLLRTPLRTAALLAAIGLTAFNLRTGVTGFAPLAERVGDDLGFGSAAIGTLGMIVTASFALFGFTAPRLARHMGLEQTMVLALGISTLGTLLRAIAPTTALLLTTSVMLFAGIGMANVLTIPLIKKWFPDRLTALSTTYAVLLQVGQVVAPIVAVAVAAPWGWHWALAIWALPLAVATVLWVIPARTPVGDSVIPSTSAALDGAVRARYWRTPALRGLVVLFSMTAFHTYTIVTWLPNIAVAAGMGEGTAAALLALFSAFGIIAGLTVPALTLRLSNPRAIVFVCVALLACGYVLLAVDTSAWIWPASVALGLGVSTFPLCLALVHRRSRTPEGATFLSGAMQGIGYGAACLGPLFVGWAVDVLGDWNVVYLVLVITLALTVYGGVVAGRPGTVESGRAKEGDAA